MIDRQNERPQCWHTGGVLFLFDSRKLNPEVDYRLNLIVQPFANVVGNYTCRNRENKRSNQIQTPSPPLCCESEIQQHYYYIMLTARYNGLGTSFLILILRTVCAILIKAKG